MQASGVQATAKRFIDNEQEYLQRLSAFFCQDRNVMPTCITREASKVGVMYLGTTASS